MKSLAIANHCGFLLGFIPSCFEGKLIAKIMTSRSTHTSQAAEFHAMNSTAVIEILAVNSSLPTTSSSEPLATSQSLTLDQLSPAFLASIVTAVKQALAAEQYYCKLRICLRRLQLVLPQACQRQARLGVFLVPLCLLASSMPKLQFWQPLALVFVCHFACYHFHDPT